MVPIDAPGHPGLDGGGEDEGVEGGAIGAGESEGSHLRQEQLFTHAMVPDKISSDVTPGLNISWKSARPKGKRLPLEHGEELGTTLEQFIREVEQALKRTPQIDEQVLHLKTAPP